jgi:branched-chain amino acid aminotransferase
MLDLQGRVAETNATHVFIVRAGRVSTPRVTACPEGITRATVLEICAANGIPCEERDLTVDDLHAADEMFCTGTMGELAGVVKLDGRAIGKAAVGPMTRRLSELFAARTAVEGEAVA